jgi:uncharacterized protein (TIGR03435 family)
VDGSTPRALRNLIAIANEITPNLAEDMIAGPKSLDTTHFTIVAKAPGSGIGAPGREGGRETAPPINVALAMLRSMLEERFKLKSHKEERPVTVFALTAQKGETKLKKAGPSDRTGCRPDPGAVPPQFSSTPVQAITCQNTTMDEFAKLLAQLAGDYFDHPVVNATGLEGGWNFTLMASPRRALENRAQNGQPGGGAAASDPGGISIFEAVEKQLGLKLDKGTRPVPVIVIDHAEEKPVD